MAEKHNSSPHGLRFLKAVSWIQLILGFLCVCLALIAVAAAFHAQALAHLSDYLMWYHQNEIQRMLDSNCTDSNLDDYDGSRTLPYISYNSYDTLERIDFKKYCELNSCNQDDYWRMTGYHLIIDYLVAPSWAGIWLIVTSFVGFRLVSYWKKPEYLEVRHSHTILNTLCFLVFAPGMLAGGITQMRYSESYYVPFRYTVGLTSVVFASVIMLLSLLVCVFNFCYPINSSKENNYKKSTEDMDPGKNGKEQHKDDALIIA